MLHCLIKRICIDGKVPAERKSNIIVTIYKNKGDKLQRHNYRGISLLCTGYKIVANCSVTIIGEYHYYAQDTKCGKLQCHNYRGISLLCTGYKMWQIAASQL